MSCPPPPQPVSFRQVSYWKNSKPSRHSQEGRSIYMRKSCPGWQAYPFGPRRDNSPPRLVSPPPLLPRRIRHFQVSDWLNFSKKNLAQPRYFGKGLSWAPETIQMGPYNLNTHLTVDTPDCLWKWNNLSDYTDSYKDSDNELKIFKLTVSPYIISQFTSSQLK